MNHWTIVAAGAAAWTLILKKHALPKGGKTTRILLRTAAAGALAAVAAAVLESPIAPLASDGHDHAIYVAAAIEETAVLAAATLSTDRTPLTTRTAAAGAAALGFTVAENLIYAARHSYGIVLLRALTVPHIAYALPWAQGQERRDRWSVAAGAVTGAALHAAVNLITHGDWQLGFAVMTGLSLLIALAPAHEL